MKKLFMILAVVAITVGCTGWRHPLLRQAWEKIETKPQDAKTILARVRTESLTEKEQAEYGLLRTMVAYKLSEKVEDDSLISASIAYYNQHGDDWHRGRAYYYRGAIRMARYGMNTDAIKDFKMAEFISEHADDKELKNRVYGMLYFVNEIFNNHPQILRYAHKRLDSSIELNDSMKIIKSLMDCATAHADIGQKDSACVYIEKALNPQLLSFAREAKLMVSMVTESSQDVGYSYLLSYVYARAAAIYQERGDTWKAGAYVKKWEETESYENIGFLTLARIRKIQGEYEKAIRLAEVEMGKEKSDQKTRMECLALLSELYELTGHQERASEARQQVKAYNDSMKYVNQTMQMVEWQQRFDEVRQTKEYYRRTTRMQALTIILIVVVALAIALGTWWHRRRVHRLSCQLDVDTQRISELRTKIEQQERSGEQNGQEMARLKEELESRMERISNTLLVGTQMFNQLQQRQSIAEATAKEQQCLVDYFAQLRPKRWQEWRRKYSGLSTAQYIFLIMQDDLHYDDEAIAAALNVKRTSVRSMRSRIKGRGK